MALRPEITAAFLNGLGADCLPGGLGVEIVELTEGLVVGRMPVTRLHLAPNGFMHAAAVIALADSMTGYGCASHLPDGATGFTTIELKSNFLGTAREGVITSEARAVHLGRSTHLWDATVLDGGGKTIALFRCTQMILRGATPAVFAPSQSQK